MDIVEKINQHLSSCENTIPVCALTLMYHDNALMKEAADEIKALRVELAMAEKFLCSNKEWCDGKEKIKKNI